MKYVVEVKNREEQNYVSMKLNNEIYGNRWNYITNDNDVFNKYKSVISNGYEIITFEEFKSRYEPKLKIGDTFEYNGFICRVDSEVLVCVYNKMLESYHKECDIQEHHLVITNKEFIKQLEENAR